MTADDLTEITVVGDDDTGLIARVTTLLFERDINIEDLDQAVREGLFRMTMRVDVTEMEPTRTELRRSLRELGTDLDLDVRVRYPSERDTRRLAVLVTKESHCAERILRACESNELDAEVAVVIGNRSRLESVAERYDVPFHDVGDERGQPDEERLLSLLDGYDVDLVVLARYMRILGPEIVFRYETRIINVHPSLLPAFPGAAAYRQAAEAGVRVAGVTAHYVTTDLDQGPILTQRAFDVPDDAAVADLKSRGRPLESAALLEAVRLHLNGDVAVHRGRTELRDPDREYQLGMLEAAERRAERAADEPMDGSRAVSGEETDD